MSDAILKYFCYVMLGCLFAGRIVAADLQPAMIASGGDSVAGKLHYPPKEAANKNEAAVIFYCEVDPQGKAHHVRTFWNKGTERFRDAVENALKTGRFAPARVGGQSTSVVLGGTVFFLSKGGAPTVAVALATAEKEKAAAFQNYIQPQLISSDADLRRKMIDRQFGITFKGSPLAANAQVAVAVDAQGNLVSKKLVAEYPAKGGFGEVLLRGLEGAKFIPAMSNGKPTSGTFGFAIDFTRVYNPDGSPGTGSHIRSDRNDDDRR